MSYQLTTTNGSIEAVIDDNCGLKKFFSIADLLTRDFSVSFTNKQDHSDTVDWNFRYKSHLLTLSFNIYNGVSVYASVKEDNEAVTEIARMLNERLY